MTESQIANQVQTDLLLTIEEIKKSLDTNSQFVSDL